MQTNTRSNTTHPPLAVINGSTKPARKKLLQDTQGEILVIRNGQLIEVCHRQPAGRTQQQAIFWLPLAKTLNKAKFFAGNISENGGTFQAVSRDRAIEIMVEWVEEVR